MRMHCCSFVCALKVVIFSCYSPPLFPGESGELGSCQDSRNKTKILADSHTRDLCPPCGEDANLLVVTLAGILG